MRFHGEARKDRYDAAIVGSGIGGLTAAALLARADLDVLVIERHDRVGGYAHSFRRGRYLFDSAVHLIGGCEPSSFEGGGLIHNLLAELGVRDRFGLLVQDLAADRRAAVEEDLGDRLHARARRIDRSLHQFRDGIQLVSVPSCHAIRKVQERDDLVREGLRGRDADLVAAAEGQA